MRPGVVDPRRSAGGRPPGEADTRTFLEASAPNGRVTVLALADIDGFKSINDTAGHAAGDDILRRFAAFGTSAMGHGERFGRLGGDEFILLLHAGTVTAAMFRVEALHRDLRDGLRTTGHPVGVSLGALIVPSGTTLDWTAALREADRLMYVAKRARKGGFRVRTLGVWAGVSPLAAA